MKGPTVSGDAVIGAGNGFMIGGDAAYRYTPFKSNNKNKSVSDAKVTRFNTVLGYLSPEFNVALHAQNTFTTYTAGYHHKIRPGVEAGAKATWNTKEKDVVVELASKVVLDKNTFVKAKIANSGVLGLGYTQTLRDGFKLSLGGLFDTTKFGENVHKIGMSINFDA